MKLRKTAAVGLLRLTGLAAAGGTAANAWWWEDSQHPSDKKWAGPNGWAKAEARRGVQCNQTFWGEY